jgi:ATP-dependent DNA ligase
MEELIQKMQVVSFTDFSVSYTVDARSNTCTCMRWKYQRLPVRQRTCKHLDSIRVRKPLLRPSITKYPDIPVEDTYFQLVTHHQSPQIEPLEYVYSIKYDGIRVRIRGHEAITRGGIRIDVTEMELPFVSVDIEYDAELIHDAQPGHNRVMEELYANRLHRLSVRVFDLIDTTLPFDERQTYVTEHVGPPYRVQYLPVHDRVHLSRVVRSVLASGEEGIVVRRCKGLYEPGRRSRYNAFKIKKALSGDLT